VHLRRSNHAVTLWQVNLPCESLQKNFLTCDNYDSVIYGRALTAHQLEFVNMVIDHLTARGAMDPRLLYESPFTDLDPLGVAGVFKEGEVVELIQILQDVKGRAAA
jgi:type I restriction enzyme, R subunit